MSAKREARRKRDREDFVRATTQSLKDLKLRHDGTPPGACAGNTYREHLEEKIEGMVTAYNQAVKRKEKDKAKTARGAIRGLVMALALYEDSYNYSIERVKKIEKEFL